MTRRPLIVAHRGGAGLRPENTLAAFEQALEMGVDGIEVDVRLSADGVLVAHHNDSLRPSITRSPDGDWLTPPTPLVKNLTLAQLKQYDVGRLRPGSDYAAARPDQHPVDGARIPTLEEIVDAVRQSKRPGMRLFLEMKTCLYDPAQGNDPKQLAAEVVRFITRHDIAARTVLISFNWRTIVHARRLLPEVSNAFITLPFRMTDPARQDMANAVGPYERMGLSRAEPAPWAAGCNWQNRPEASHSARMVQTVAAARDEGWADSWFAWYGDVNAETAALAHNLGLEISCWTVNKTADMAAVTDYGAVAIVTDRPDRLSRLLGSGLAVNGEREP